MKIECKHCKEQFERVNPRKTFCSRKCIHDFWYSKPENKEAKKARSKNWEVRKPEKQLAKKLKFYYNMTVEQFNQMLASQNGVCKICERICPTGRRLSVDHDHKTGKIRGLLCSKCNKGLGSFEDSIHNIEKSILYLRGEL